MLVSYLHQQFSWLRARLWPMSLSQQSLKMVQDELRPKEIGPDGSISSRVSCVTHSVTSSDRSSSNSLPSGKIPDLLQKRRGKKVM